jgi:hypothetical protein
MAAKKTRPRLDDFISKKQLAFIVTLGLLIGSHYLAWPEALTENIMKLILSYLGAQVGVDLVLALKGTKTR